MSFQRERSRSRSREHDTREDNRKNYIDISNIPQHYNKEDIVYFIWKTLDMCKALKKHTNPITASEFVQESRCIRLHFRSREQALNCLDLNGIYYGTKAFYMKSPITIRQFPQIVLKDVKLRKISSKVQDGFNKLHVTNLPPSLLQYQIVNMLSDIGELKSFQPIYKDNIIQHCYFEFKNQEQTEECLIKLNNLKVKGRQIVAKRAALLADAGKNRTVIKSKVKSNLFEKDLHSFYLTFDTVGFFKNKKVSCILCLRNIIPTAAEKDFICLDLKKELQKVGPISKIVHKEKTVYIEFERFQYAQISYLLLMNRKYDGKPFEISFYDALDFADDILV